MSDIQTWFDQGKALAGQATPGPWEVGESSDGWSEIYGRDPIEPMVTPTVATTERGGEDEAAFIADARTRLPLALAAIQEVLSAHRRSQYGGCTHTACDSGSAWPCPTVEMIQDALGQDA